MNATLEVESMEHRNHKVEKLRDKIRPLYDWVFCVNQKRVNRVGSLWVPDSAREDLQQGEVVAVGDGQITEFGRLKMTIKTGDVILWAKHWEKPVDISDHEQYVAVREKDVIGLVRDHGKRLEPIYNTVVVRMDPLPDKHGSLWLPQSAQVKKPLMPLMSATVVDAGLGHQMDDGTFRPLAVRCHDRVLVESFGGEDHSFDETSLRLIPEEHILAVIDK